MIPTVTAHSGLTLPVLSFGTDKLKGRASTDAIGSAIERCRSAVLHQLSRAEAVAAAG